MQLIFSDIVHAANSVNNCADDLSRISESNNLGIPRVSSFAGNQRVYLVPPHLLADVEGNTLFLSADFSAYLPW
jgi:hypothetical protein